MKFTYYTIIGKDLNLLKGHVENVRKYSGFDDLTCDKEFIVVVYKNSKIPETVTNDILSYCVDNDIRTHVYDEPTTSFLDNLYHCWNLGYELADDGYVFRGGSDQVFSKDSFVHLYNEAEKLREKGIKNILQANTIENGTRLREMRVVSRHFMEDFGSNFGDFNYPKFEEFVTKINENVTDNILDTTQSLATWGKPTSFTSSLGHIDRTDGCSWLMTKQDWLDYGPLPTMDLGHTGDVIIHDRVQKAGYSNYIVKDCVTYHFVRGESFKTTQH